MDNQLIQRLKEAKGKGAKLFCAYLTLGFPNLSTTEALILALAHAGADIIELGFPFSDPLADGPTIQFASAQAIKKNVRLNDAFRLVRKLRKRGLRISILLFTYLNPIMHYGMSRAIRQLHQSGFDGLIVPDLPPDEGKMWESWFQRFNLSLVYLIAPTTDHARAKEIAKRSSGFVYYVSLRGVTGARSSISPDLIRNLRIVKKMTKKPVLVGFGVSSPKQARAITKVPDGIIVGSAIVERLKGGRKGVRSAVSFASSLMAAMKRKE